MTGVQKAIKIGAICLAVFIITCIFNGILFAVGIIGGVETETKSFTENYSEINNIEIDVTALNITIEKGEEFKVDAVEASEDLKVTQVGNTLKVKERSSWFFKVNKGGSIKITVPSGVLGKLDVDSGAGTITISNLVVDNLNVDQGAGSIAIDGSSFKYTNIDGDAGEIKITNSNLNNLDLDCGVGRVTISGLVHGNSKIDSDVGELNLELMESADNYRIIAEKGIGSITINNESYKDNTTYGTGENSIRIDGGVGAINVSFKETSVN